MKNSMEFLQKAKNRVDPAIPLLDIYPDKTVIQKNIYTLMFIESLFTIAGLGNNLNVHQQMNG